MPGKRPVRPPLQATPSPTSAIAQSLDSAAGKLKFRRYALASAATAIAIAGAWYGGSIKTEHEVLKTKKKMYEASDEDLIKMLTTQRNKHERIKVEVENRLDVLAKRMEETAKKEAEKEAEKRADEVQQSTTPTLPTPKQRPTAVTAISREADKKAGSWW